MISRKKTRVCSFKKCETPMTKAESGFDQNSWIGIKFRSFSSKIYIKVLVQVVLNALNIAYPLSV